MASSSQGLRTGIQIGLGIAIIALTYFLYVSITEPYEAIEREQEVTQQTRQRMDHVRKALIQYERETDRFPGSLDSLITYMRADTTFSPDSLYQDIEGEVNIDSILYSPRTGSAFEYTVNDTGAVDIYLLKDPDSEDQIGATDPDPTQINAASWE